MPSLTYMYIYMYIYKHLYLDMFLEFLFNSNGHSIVHNCSKTTSYLFKFRLNLDILLDRFSHLFFFKIALTEKIFTSTFKNNLSLVVLSLRDCIVHLPVGPVSLELDSILKTTAYFAIKSSI